MAHLDPDQRVFVTGGSGFLGGHLLERLQREGHEVVALARSDGSARRVQELGAEVVRGDLGDVDALAAGMRGCDLVVHLAAHVGERGTRERFFEVNVRGTDHVVTAARAAGIRRLVHASTEAVLLDADRDLVDLSEATPRADDPVGPYGWSKGLAEEVVEEANGPGLETVILRPRFVWGPGDTTLLPRFVEAVEGGEFWWVGGGDYPFATTHVGNAVEGLLLAAALGEPGGIYFVTDGEPATFREFLTELLATRGITPPDRSLPRWLIRALARANEAAWRWLPLRGHPPFTLEGVRLVGETCTIDITRARRELGYEPVVSREEGLEALQELQEAHGSQGMDASARADGSEG